MNRSQLEHVIRAAATIAGDTEIVVIGSQATLGPYPDAPAELPVSADADVYPRNHPERADLVEGSIGELSPFHDAYGYYAQAVGERTAVLPEGWEERLVAVPTPAGRGLCLEPHDLVVSKYVAGRQKDRDYVRAAIRFVGFGGGFGVADIATELGPLSENLFSSAAWSGNPNDPATKAFYKKFYDKYNFYPKEHEVEGYAVIYILADALNRAKLTGKLEDDREAIRQSLLKTDMVTVFGKVKFGNYKGPLGDQYTNQNIYPPDHSVLAQWRGGKLPNVYPKAVAEIDVVFPDPTVKR